MKFKNIDLDGGSFGGGNVANLIANGEGVNALRTNDTLRKDEWKALDTAVVQAARKRLRIVADIRSRGLTYNLANALGTTILETEAASGMNDASINMTGKARIDNDAAEFELSGLPIPIVSKGFVINARKLAASRKLGQSLDTLQAELAAYKVSDAVETLTVTGSNGLSYGGYTIYGLENAPNANTGTLTAAWTDTTNRDPVADVQAMIQDLVDVKMFGPYELIVPTAYQTALGDDYTTNYPITIRERIEKLDGIEVVRVSDHATSTKVTLFQLSPETVRIVVGQDPAAVSWKSGDNMEMFFKVMAILVPQVRSDYDGNCGIAVYSA